MPSDYLCNLILPGAGKSGTTSLHGWLDRHPLVSMSTNKEPHHFCVDRKYQRGADFHNSLFEQQTGTLIFGESSTGYLPLQRARERIARDIDKPKIIIVLRHPVERTFSHYRWRYRLGLETRSFMEAMKSDGFGYNPEQPDIFGYKAYLEFSQYSQQCPAWIDAFGLENCLLINSDDLRANRDSVMARCFDFLGLPAMGVDYGDERNSTDSLGRRPSSLMAGVAKLIPENLKNSRAYKTAKRKMLTFGAATPPANMTGEEREFLQDVLAEDMRWFESTFATSQQNPVPST